MKKKLFIIMALLMPAFFSFGQQFEQFGLLTENMAPNIGGTDFYENKVVSKLKAKYNIDLMFSKINSVNEGKCVFSFNDGKTLQTAELSPGESFPYTIQNARQTIRVEAKFVKLILNKAVPLESKAQMEYKLFKKSSDKKPKKQ